jgi:Uma2 family endonuclease
MATLTRQIGPTDHGQRMTLDEFIDADFKEGWLYELARGVIDVTDVAAINHGRIVDRITTMFVLYGEKHKHVISYRANGSECRLRLPGMQSDRHPDQAIYLLPPPAGVRPWTRWVPQVVVEVVSEGGEHRDNVEKREEYLVAGVTEY